jgi:hypothetical protein
MPPIILTLLAFMAGLFQSRAHCTWKTLHCGINWQSTNRLSIARDFTRPIVYSGHGSRGCGLPGKMP